MKCGQTIRAIRSRDFVAQTVSAPLLDYFDAGIVGLGSSMFGFAAMTDEIEEPETSLALMTLALAGVAIAVMVLIFAAQPADGGTVCLTYKQARHLWPKVHLFWYGRDHCWSNRRGPPRNLHIDPVFPKNAMAEETKKPRPAGGVIKIVKADEYNEMDAAADEDTFFNAKPFPLWRSLSVVEPYVFSELWANRVSSHFTFNAVSTGQEK